MYRHILVPLDLGEHPAALIERAREQLDPQTGVVSLLHAIEPIEEVPESESFYDHFREKARQVLKDAASRLSGGGWQIREEIRVGHRVRTIIEYANDERCDLIVLGAHRVDPTEGLKTLGTISHQVAVLAPCSVLLVR